MSPPTPRARRAAIAITGMLVSGLLASINSSRSYDYDESVTVGFFIRQDNPLAAVTEQKIFNNHPALSGLNWIVWHLGGDTEPWQRLVPLVAGAACIAMVSLWCSRRHGLLAAATATGLLATNPLMLEAMRTARGYALAALFLTASTIYVDEWWRRERSLRLGYSLLAAAALLSHLYVAIPIVAHGVATFTAHRDRFGTWASAVIRGVFIASPIYLAMLPTMASAAGSRQGSFVADFPLEALRAAVGSPITGTAIGLAIAGTVMKVGRTDVRWMAGSIGVMLLVVWIVVRPFDLYPRFLVWAIPLGAMALSAAVARWRSIAILCVASVAVWAPDVSELLDEESDIRDVSTVFLEQRSSGRDVCTYGFFAESLRGYVDPPPTDLTEGECDVVFFRTQDADELPVGVTVVGAVPGAPSTCIAVADRTAFGTNAGGSCDVPIS